MAKISHSIDIIKNVDILKLKNLHLIYLLLEAKQLVKLKLKGGQLFHQSLV
jgi:hypothetical protein